MPYADPDKQRAYQREWMARRRAEWFMAHGPCSECGSWDWLEVDHRDPSKKISHRVWSWTRERMEAELAKCQVLCHDHHVAKTVANGEKPRGERNGVSRYSNELRAEVLRRVAAGERQCDIARDLGLKAWTVFDFVRRLPAGVA